jgi:hypothetical protein
VLYLRSTTGTVARLGEPDPDGTQITLAESGTTLVAYNQTAESDNGSAVLMNFDHPGVFHRFIPKDQGAQTICGSVTTSRIACTSNSGGGKSQQLFTTSGKRVISTNRHCPGDGALALGHSLAWVIPSGASCAKNGLVIVSLHSTVTVAPGHNYEPYRGVAAFGQLVIGRHHVTTNFDTELVLVTSATHQRILVDGG